MTSAASAKKWTRFSPDDVPGPGQSRTKASWTSAVGCSVWSGRSPRMRRAAIRRSSG